MNSSPVGWLAHWWAKLFCSVWFQLWQFWAASSALSGQWTDNQQSQNPSSLLHAQLNSECQVFWNMLHVVILITCCVCIKKSLNESLDITFLTTTALIRFIWSRDQVQSPLSMGKFLFFFQVLSFRFCFHHSCVSYIGLGINKNFWKLSPPEVSVILTQISGGSRISRGWNTNPLLGIFFVENCMKMK